MRGAGEENLLEDGLWAVQQRHAMERRMEGAWKGGGPLCLLAVASIRGVCPRSETSKTDESSCQADASLAIPPFPTRGGHCVTTTGTY